MVRPFPVFLAFAFAGPTTALADATSADATGVWSGKLRVAGDSGGAACAYEGERAATLELVQEGSRVRGFVGLTAPAQEGSPCPALRKRWRVRGSASGGSLVLQDDAGHEWTLGLRNGALVGLLAWKAGIGRDEPLAEGFQAPSGETPLARLTGEVSLGRSGPGVADAATPPGPPKPGAPPGKTPTQPPATALQTPSASSPEPRASPAPKSGVPAAQARTGGGGKGKGTIAIIGANVVGVGAFLAVNSLAQDTPGGFQNTCSPRECIVGVAGEGCDCGPNDTGIVTGADCGEIDGGALLGAACDPPARPCATGLSCNSGVCQDSAGACPFQ
jgi:hypothetical protein